MRKERPTQVTPAEQKSLLPYDVVDRRIRQMEREHDLLQYTVNGWCVWPLLRFAVQFTLAYDLGGLSSAPSWGQRLSMALQDLPSLLTLRQARYVVKTYTSGLAEQEGSFYKDIWFDDLIKELGTCLKIETINSSSFIPRRQAALIKSDLTSNGFYLVAGSLAVLGGPRNIPAIAQCLNTCLRSEFATEFFTSRWIVLRLRYFYWLKQLYSRLLKHIRPAYLLTADGGEHALVAAAKELGIIVIELQHGLIDRYHGGYSWTSYALPYRARMSVPDRLLLYGEHWKKELETNGFWQETLRVVGNPRIEQCRHRRARGTLPDLCTLLLTTQGLAVEALIAFMAEFLKISEGQLELRLFIKLHPVYERSKTRYLEAFQADTRVQIWLGNESPATLELLTQVHFHLSISSTCHYEALGVGVPTVILPLPSHETVLPLYQAGHAALVHTPRDLLDIVLQHKTEKVAEETGAYYFARDAIARMTQELA